jgi:hypothetical protein
LDKTPPGLAEVKEGLNSIKLENIILILYTLLLLACFILFMFVFKYISTGKEGVKDLYNKLKHPFKTED